MIFKNNFKKNILIILILFYIGINLCNAADTISPSAITDLFALQTNYAGQVKLKWTAVGNDGEIGNITNGRYRIQYSSITPINWDVNNYTLEYPTDTIVGEIQTKVISGLEFGATYFFCIWTADEIPNWSTYIDTISCFTQEINLSIQLDKATYNFGNLSQNVNTVADSSITITNNGNVYSKYSIVSSSSTRWIIGNVSDIDQFTLSAAFNDTKPVTGDFTSEDQLSSGSKLSSGTVFSISGIQTGINVPVGGQRNLWFMLGTPTATSSPVEQDIEITITTELDTQ